jgi:hypothetical protein
MTIKSLISADLLNTVESYNETLPQPEEPNTDYSYIKTEGLNTLAAWGDKEVNEATGLSPALLSRYKKGAGEYASSADSLSSTFHKIGDHETAKKFTDKSNKRFSGILKATRKQFDNDSNGIKEGLADDFLSMAKGMKNPNGSPRFANARIVTPEEKIKERQALDAKRAEELKNNPPKPRVYADDEKDDNSRGYGKGRYMGDSVEYAGLDSIIEGRMVPTHNASGKPNPNHPAYSKHKAAYDSEQAEVEASTFSLKNQDARNKAAKKPTENPVKMSHIDDAIGSSYPDVEPYDHLSRQFPELHKQNKLSDMADKAIRANTKHKSFSHYTDDMYKQFKADSDHDEKMMGEDTVLDEQSAQEFMANAMNSIDPQHRSAARKTYRDARNRGMTHASALTNMYNKHRKVNESVSQLDEVRMPLQGHPYHDKTDDQLKYIIKDAGEAARAQKGMSSEGKYLDQVNDATTVLYHRKKQQVKEAFQAVMPQPQRGPTQVEMDKAQAHVKKAHPGMKLNGVAIGMDGKVNVKAVKTASSVVEESELTELDTSTYKEYLQGRKQSGKPNSIHKAVKQALGVRIAKEKLQAKEAKAKADSMGKVYQ